VECLAGARQGQGDEVVAALPRENIKHLSVGIISYSVFSTVHMVAARLSPAGDDPALWRQLILQPAGGGPNSGCFTHLFRRALLRHKGSKVFLDLIRTEMNRATQERSPGSLNQWQHLEQMVVRHQESEELNARYQRAIEDLETSLKIQQPMIEQKETARLGRTLESEFLALSMTEALNTMNQGTGKDFHPLLFKAFRDLVKAQAEDP